MARYSWRMNPLAPDFLTAMSQRAQRIRQCLETAPLVEMSGVVEASGVGASRMRDEPDWSLTFQCPAWRLDGRELSRDRLTVRRSVAHDQIDAWQALLPPLAVVRFRARLADDADMGGYQALLVELLPGPGNDPELAAIAHELSQPVVVDDPVLGPLTLDRRIDNFIGEARFLGHSVAVHLEGGTPADVSAAQAAAHAVWNDAQRWHLEAAACAARQLLETKNDNWLDESEPVLDEAAFVARMRLQTISACGDGDIEFWFADGDLFAGHSIHVRGTLADGFESASIAG